MGAQAAAALGSGGPVGDVPEHAYDTGSTHLDLAGAGHRALGVDPDGSGLALVALSHGHVGLAPTAWDGTSLHLRLPDPVRVDPDGTVRWSGGRPEVAVLRRVLALDDDLEPLWRACDRVEELSWVRPARAGRTLRSATVWEDLVKVLSGTRTSYAGSRAMLRQLVGDGPFPTPEQVVGRDDLSAWGHRARHLRALAEEVTDGWDPESLWSLDDGGVQERVRRLGGFGPFAATQVLPLLGRPRPLVHDGWLVREVGGVERFAPMGAWAGTGAWLSLTGRWLAP